MHLFKKVQNYLIANATIYSIAVTYNESHVIFTNSTSLESETNMNNDIAIAQQKIILNSVLSSIQWNFYIKNILKYFFYFSNPVPH